MHHRVEQLMSWSRRKTHEYYYRSRRIDRRVVKEYVGRGPAAELVAHADESIREERQQRAAAEASLQQQYLNLDRQLKVFHHETAWLIRATLVAAGLYQHARGNWRRRPR